MSPFLTLDEPTGGGFRPPLFFGAGARAMSLMNPNMAPEWTSELESLRCVECYGPIGPAGGAPALACAACGRTYPIRDDVLVVKEEVAADNRIAADFYNSKLWPKFRVWEWLFWLAHGGERRARE